MALSKYSERARDIVERACDLVSKGYCAPGDDVSASKFWKKKYCRAPPVMALGSKRRQLTPRVIVTALCLESGFLPLPRGEPKLPLQDIWRTTGVTDSTKLETIADLIDCFFVCCLRGDTKSWSDLALDLRQGVEEMLMYSPYRDGFIVTRAEFCEDAAVDLYNGLYTAEEIAALLTHSENRIGHVMDYWTKYALALFYGLLTSGRLCFGPFSVDPAALCGTTVDVRMFLFSMLWCRQPQGASQPTPAVRQAEENWPKLGSQ